IFPGNAGVEFNLAECYNEIGQVSEAKVQYTQTLFHLSSGSTTSIYYRSVALWRLAVLNYREGEFDRAKFYLIRYVKYNPERLFARYMLGYNIYFRQGDYERARRELEYVAQADRDSKAEENLDPDDVKTALGQIYFVEDDMRYERLLADVTAHRKADELSVALLNTARGEYDKALAFLIPFAQKHPEHFIARAAIVKILEKTGKDNVLAEELIRVSRLALQVGRNRDGIDFAEHALLLKVKKPEIPVDTAEAYRLLGAHYEALHQPYRAVLYAHKAVELLMAAPAPAAQEAAKEKQDQLFEMRMWLARLMGDSSVRRFDEAAAICDEYLGTGKDAKVLSTRALIYMEAGKNDRAVVDLTKAMELDPESSVSLHYYRAIAHQSLRDIAAAESDLQKVLEKRPDFADANNFLGYIYADAGKNLPEALRLIQKAVESSPVSGAFQDSLGWVYFKMGRTSEARYHVQLAALLLEEAGTEDASVYEHLGEILARLGLSKESVNAFERGLVVLDKKKERVRAVGGAASADDLATEERIRTKLGKQ
ncbi:MAG: tetratricopeptide repeat protein, partial [Spirochaetia bacterium]|nr:tetratricopeptide repeat protein [Spirochaetia bacterium]